MGHSAAVIMHIGLPKTATTVLQRQLFEGNGSQCIEYLGVRQPRSREQQDLYLAITRALDCEEPDKEHSLASAKEKLSGAVRSLGKPVLLSEEGITVDGPVNDWQEKIARLGRLLRDTDYSILVTVREPIDAAYSLYVELYPRLRRQYADFMHYFTDSNAARIYRYGYLYNVLSSAFAAERIRYVPFELIKIGREYVTAIEQVLGCGIPDVDQLDRENFKEVGTSGYVSEGASVADMLQGVRNNPVARILYRIPGLKAVAKSLYDSIKGVKVGGGSEIPYLSEGQRAQVAASLQDDNRDFKSATGIDYC